jgi:hypothetical protein
VAVSAPSDDTLARIEDGLVSQHDGCVIARFSNVLVVVSPSENEPLAEWLQGSFATEDLIASLGSGAGVLQIMPNNSDIRLDYKSSSVMDTLAALVEN